MNLLQNFIVQLMRETLSKYDQMAKVIKDQIAFIDSELKGK